MSDSDKDENTEEVQQQTSQNNQGQLPRKTAKGYPIYYFSDIRPPAGTKDPDTGKEIEEKDGAGFGEFYQMMMLVCGAYTYWYQSKPGAWLTLFLLWSSVINFSFEHMMSQGSTMFSMVIYVFIAAYAPKSHMMGANRYKKAAESLMGAKPEDMLDAR